MTNIVQLHPDADELTQAKQALSDILERKQLLEDYCAQVQPLLYEASLILYPTDFDTISLDTLINDTITLIKGANK